MEDAVSHESMDLFGGDRGWSASSWTASDDRVRGGSSQSYLECSEKTARFYGVLDIKTLGGAGFASQRTTEEATWNLSKYCGLSISITDSDGEFSRVCSLSSWGSRDRPPYVSLEAEEGALAKQYTLILKDEVLPKDPNNGREQATISYEHDFTVKEKQANIFIPWSEFKPTYRGKERKDAPPLDLKNIKRFSIMTRSFFGTQEGSFSLSIQSISAVKTRKPTNPRELEQGGRVTSERGWYMKLLPVAWKLCACTVLVTAALFYHVYGSRDWRA